MKEQNFKNHSRLVTLFHFVAYPLALLIVVGSAWKLYTTYLLHWSMFYPLALIGCGVVLLLTLFFARSFALKAQDRAIRAEENLRYFAITGKLLDSKLTTRQIIALRFAPNNEFVDLAHKAVAENLSAKQIKEAIVHWRADHHRV